VIAERQRAFLPLSKTSFHPVGKPLLQRKCVCGAKRDADGECEECRKKRQQCTPVVTYPHDFAKIALRSRPPSTLSNRRVEPDNHDGSEETDEESQEEPAVMGETVPLPAAVPLEESGKAVKCPTKTAVDKLIDTTPAGIKKGYRTGYGATALMRVEPDSTTWDGVQIVEALKQTKNTCPEEFGISPCSGNSTFPVGAEANSSVLGKLVAQRNRFYDHHFTRWNKGSLLHDRNPKNISSCEIVCEQNYSCGGKVIGTHTITRAFTKGTSGSRDVTLVNVTKK
jgi:hypothetical protein